MIVRINGGNAGIKEYLESGNKQGRYFSRDELDYRSVLAGNLNLTDKIISSIEDKGQERYYHITLSFKEDDISSEKLINIVEDYKKILLSAYNEEEYNFYAEAHLPKIKQILDKKTGEFIERKSHIHIVIPKTNLVTQKHFSPLGLIDSSINELDAIQEYINYKYNLATPKEYIRLNDINIKANVLSRIKGDLFREKNHDIKLKLADQIIKGKINSINEFEKELKKLGVVTIRNKNKPNQYHSVKPVNSKKGINFKNHIFSKSFIETKELENKRLSKKEVDILLNKWVTVDSREKKHILTASKKIKNEYFSLKTNDEKISYLTNCDKNYNKKFNLETQLKQTIEKNVTLNTIKPINTSRNNLDIAKSSYTKQILNNKKSLAKKITSIKDISADRLINHLQYSHFIDITKYKVKGSYIIYNNKTYDPVELLKEHINLRDDEIVNIIQASKKNNIKLSQKDHYIKTESNLLKLQQDLRFSNKNFFKSYKQMFYENRKNFSEGITALIEQSRHENVNFDQELTVLIFRKLQEEEKITEFRNIVLSSQNKIKQSLQCNAYIKPKEKKMDILTEQEQENAIGNQVDRNDLIAESNREEKFANWYNQNRENLKKANVLIEKRGTAVFYYDKEHPENPFLKDDGKAIYFKTKDITVDKLIIALDLAKAKYGNVLTITGNKDFKNKVLEVIAKEKLDIIPKNKTLLQQLQQIKEDLKQEELQSENNNINEESIEKPISDYKEVVEYGSAPYLFDKNNSDSYYIKVKDPETNEISTQFGIGLKDAIEENNIQVGDQVKLHNLGREPVKIKVKEIDEKGKTNIIEKEVYRNKWNIEKDLSKEIIMETNKYTDQVKQDIGRYAQSLPITDQMRENIKDPDYKNAFINQSMQEFKDRGYNEQQANIKETVKDEQSEITTEAITINENGENYTIQISTNRQNNEVDCIVLGQNTGGFSMKERTSFANALEKNPRMQELFTKDEINQIAHSGKVTKINIERTHTVTDNEVKTSEIYEQEDILDI